MILINIILLTLRGMALCLIWLFARIGSMTGNNLIAALLYINCDSIFYTFAVMLFCKFVGIKNKNKKQIDPDAQDRTFPLRTGISSVFSIYLFSVNYNRIISYNNLTNIVPACVLVFLTLPSGSNSKPTAIKANAEARIPA